MHIRLSSVSAAATVVALVTLFTVPALAQSATTVAAGPDNHPAARHMEKLGGEVLAVLGDATLGDDERIAQFRRVLARDLDIPMIARFVAGRHWRKSTPAQRTAYLEVFRHYLVRTFSARLGGVSVDRFEVVGTKGIGKTDILVRSRIIPAGAKPVRADWRVRAKDGSFRILDLSVEGISMALTLRKEFSSILRRKGDVEALIPLLKDHTT